MILTDCLVMNEQQRAAFAAEEALAAGKSLPPETPSEAEDVSRRMDMLI